MNNKLSALLLISILQLVAVSLMAVAFADTADTSNPGLPRPAQNSDYRLHPAPMVELGRMLFYDRVLSGTYRVSCATCHNPDRASSNGFSRAGVEQVKGDDLAINGLSIYDQLKPSSKHAPPLFNLGAREFQSLFGDGRVARGDDGRFISPAGGELPNGLNDVLAVQALFPAVTGDELVGTVGNDVSAVAHLGNKAIWDRLALRVLDLPDYAPLFEKAYPELSPFKRISMVNIANAISAFVAHEWRSDGSAFDAYLRGDLTALSKRQKRGMTLFYGKANCSSCHSGVFQTDHGFHAVAMPLWRFDAELSTADGDLFRDRLAQTGQQSDRHKRRTPSLRNVEHTAPYGHAGSHETLEGVVKAHMNPIKALRTFVSDRLLAGDRPAGLGELVGSVIASSELDPIELSNSEVDDIVAFLKSLSEPSVLVGRLGRPDEVPSYLALD